VLTVVLKLFNIIRPQLAILGQKDAQQLACIQRMVTDLNLGIEVIGGPIIREPDGLAISSRNIYLTAIERPVALSISAALEKAATQSSVPAARSAAHEVLDRAEAEPCFELDYASIVNPTTFTDVADDHVGPAIFVVAARVGNTRLIDNTIINFAPPPWA
jgi:pantoate--beta-alanine ligase